MDMTLAALHEAASKEIPSVVAEVTGKFDEHPAAAAYYLAVCCEGHALMTRGRIGAIDAESIANQLQQAADLYRSFAVTKGAH